MKSFRFTLLKPVKFTLKPNWKGYHKAILTEENQGWKERVNHIEFFDRLGYQCGVKEINDFYTITPELVHQFGGESILQQYNNSIWIAIQNLYPEQQWTPWKDRKVPRVFWTKKENQKRFFDWLGRQLEFKDMDDWYSVTVDTIYKHGGAGLLARKYCGSPYLALKSVYPHYDWQLWKFKRVPKNQSKNTEKYKNFFMWLEKKLNILKPEDWYRVSLHQINAVVPINRIIKYGGLAKLLCKVYPHVKWDLHKLNMPKEQLKSSQRQLTHVIQELFAKNIVKENYKHNDMRFVSSGRTMELDVYLPQLKLAFEYQGEHHFGNIYAMKESGTVSARDNEKRDKSLVEGITLIEVPYWWDGTSASLAATIHQYRPDLIDKPIGAEAIPSSPQKPLIFSSRVTLAFLHLKVKLCHSQELQNGMEEKISQGGMFSLCST